MVPRPPTTTTCAEPRSGRPEPARSVRSTSATRRARPLTTTACSTTSGLLAVSESEAVTVLGLTVTTATGAVTAQRVVHVPAKTVLPATTCPPSTTSASASMTTPAPVATASRAATSLFSKEDTSSTSGAPTAERTCSTASATTAVRCGSASVTSRCTRRTPSLPRSSIAAAGSSPAQAPSTPDSPASVRASVSSSRTGVRSDALGGVVEQHQDGSGGGLSSHGVLAGLAWCSWRAARVAGRVRRACARRGTRPGAPRRRRRR